MATAKELDRIASKVGVKCAAAIHRLDLPASVAPEYVSEAHRIACTRGLQLACAMHMVAAQCVVSEYKASGDTLVDLQTEVMNFLIDRVNQIMKERN